MHILELPLELFQEILGWAIHVRGIKRGLRLRLVNKVFATEVLTALSLFKLLDSYYTTIPVGEDFAISPVAIAYLERRVLHEPNHGLPTLLRIRSVATRLCQGSVDGRGVQDYIRQLSPLVVATCREHIAELWGAERAGGLLRASDLESDVYIAALYTQTLPVVARWTASGKELARKSWLFGSAYRHAAKYGSHETLAAMMTQFYEDEFQIRRTDLLSLVAEYGRVAATHFVFDFDATQRPWRFSRKKTRPRYPYRNERAFASIHTPSREIFDFLTEKRRIHCVGGEFGCKEHTNFLLHCAQEGWADVAACYLELGASVDGLGLLPSDDKRPLVRACRNGHEDVIRVLLAYGADTSQLALETAVRYGHFTVVSLLLDHGAEFGGAIAAAVAKGSRTVVQTLLKHSRDGDAKLQEWLVRAVELEDEVLFRLLVEHSGGP